MKQYSKAGKAKSRQKFDKKLFEKKLKASGKEMSRTKAELIKAAHSENRGIPEYLWPDRTDDAWMRRTSTNSDFIEKRGGFSRQIVSLALLNPGWETKESVAAWLRKELKKLREAEAKPGAAPVKRGQALSRLEISEIAIDLLEPLAGQALVCLFQELLEVDRHRKALADDFVRLDRAANIEAQMRLQGLPLGVRELAKRMSVAPSTVTRWRNSESYGERVQFYKNLWENLLRDNYFEQIKAADREAADEECFRRAFQMCIENAVQRQDRILNQTEKH